MHRAVFKRQGHHATGWSGSGIVLISLAVLLLTFHVARAADLTLTAADQDGAAIAGAKVYLYTADLSYTGNYGASDENGLVSFGAQEQFVDGSYRFKAKYMGKDYWSDAFELPATPEVVLTIPCASVSVGVYYAGQPSGQCNVYLYSAEGCYLSVYQDTGGDGQAVFRLPVGANVRFRAKLFSYQYDSAVIQVADNNANMVTIDAGGGQITASVQTDSAAPLAGLHVKLYNTEGCYLAQNPVTDDNGVAVLNVAQGAYRLRADYLGYSFWSQDITVSDNIAVTIPIAHQDVTITVAGAYSGASSPIANCNVHVYTEAGNWTGVNGTTDDNGQVHFSLPGQAYLAKATYLGQTYDSAVFTAADAGILIPMGRAEVTVDWNGSPLTDLMVYVYTGEDSWTGIKGTTGAAGQCLFTLPEGAWKFRTNYQANQYWSAATPLTADTDSAVALSTGGGALTLTIGKDDSQPLEGLNCVVYTDTGAWTGVKGATNSAGDVSFDLAQGSYKIRVSYLGYNFWSEIYTVTQAMTDTLHIPHQDVTVTVAGQGPIENAKVNIYTGDEHWTPLYASTDSAGQAVFSLPEREYKARVTYLRNQIWSDPFVWQPADVAVPIADVLVSVTGAGQVIENARVTVYTDSDSYLGLSGTTDINGQISFLLPATDIGYKFKARYQGHSFFSDPRVPVASQVNDIAIATGGGNVTFSLLKDTQSPITNARCYLYDAAGLSYLGLWAYTDDNGQVQFDLVDGSFTIKVKYLGYTYFSDTFSVPDTLSPSLTIGHSDVQISVHGVLSDATPIENAKMYLYTAAGGWLGLPRFTDADGHAVYTLPARDYKVNVYYLGQWFWSDSFNSQDTSVDIPLAMAQVTVTGAGQQFEGVKVYAYTDSDKYLGVYQSTDDSGQSPFILPAGGYKFAAYYQGKKFWTDAVTLTAGNTSAVTIDTGGGLFRLSLQKDQNNWLADVKCYVYTDTDKCIGMYGTTDVQGSVVFALSEGAYKFKIKYQGNDYWTDPVSVPQTLALTHTLDHQRYPVFVRGIHPAQPMENIKLYAYTEAGAYTGQHTATDARGRANIDLAAGFFKAKYYYNGQYSWTGILQPAGTMISINQDGSPALDAVADLNATANGSGQVELTWTASPGNDGLTAAGYYLYRRAVCQDNFELITADLLTATSFMDSGLDDITYTYYVVAVTGSGDPGYPGQIVSVQLGSGAAGQNTTGITDLAATWQQGVARLTWSEQTGCTYQIFRGTASNNLSAWARSDTNSYSDPTAGANQTWYYQVATIKTLCDPQTGAPVESMGPLSSIVTLAALDQPSAGTINLPINAQGDYVITTGAGQSYQLQGTYQGFDGDVTVTAVLGDVTVTGTGSGGQFSIELPTAGDWQIIITDADGWQSTTIDTEWRIDDLPPTLSVDGASSRSTTESTVTVTGLVSDQQSALQGVRIVSDRYPGLPFDAAIGTMGSFSAEVPLKPDANQLTVSAADIHGNTAGVSISITQELTALPVITITSPTDGETVNTQPISVAGTVRSSLPPEQIQLQLGDQVIFPEGGTTPYTFTFDQVSLSPGGNLLTITARTPHGTTSATAGVMYSTQTNQGEAEKPKIEVYAPLPDTFLTENSVVTGLVTGQSAIQSVTVNNQPALCTGLGSTHVSFQAAPAVSGGQQNLTITISATDSNSQTANLSYTVSIDANAPVIQLDTNSQAPPAVNPVNDSPYTISGTVSDSYMAGLSVNDQSVTLTPEGDNLYRFSASLALSFGQTQTITLMAWDLAGNRTGAEWIVSLSSDLTLEVISPRNGAKLQVQGATADVAVTVRVSGAAATDGFTVALDDNPAQPLARAGSLGNTTLAVPTGQAAHQLSFSVQNNAGGELARTVTSFSLENMDDVPLAVEEQRPANGANGIEPNAFVAVYFNKTIDPGLLDIQVIETSHGKTYDTAGNGADITELGDIHLIEVHRDREPVPGGISHFPGNRMAAFYPERDLAYGATVFVNVIYDGAELSRTSYKVRDLPSLIEGFVTDSAANPVPGVKVRIPKLDLTAETNSDGAYAFGFGMDASQALAAGRYELVVNPGMQNTAYGTLTYQVRVRQGQLNSMPVVKLPVISAQIPFRRIISARAENSLAGGALKLDLSQAQLTFPDLRQQGDVHVQFLSVEKLPYAPLPYATPLWVFCTQPAGVKVSGEVGLSLAVPARSGDYTYLQDYGSLVVLVGLDPDALMIVPVGVGQMDMDAKRVTSRGQVHLKRLDFIGYVHMKAEVQPLLEHYINQEISLSQLIAGLENF